MIVPLNVRTGSRPPIISDNIGDRPAVSASFCLKIHNFKDHRILNVTYHTTAFNPKRSSNAAWGPTNQKPPSRTGAKGGKRT